MKLENYFWIAYNGILNWQDKDVMSTYSKQRLKDIPKGTGFRAQDCTESLYRFLETTARNNVVVGFLLKICAQCAQVRPGGAPNCVGNARSVHTCVA